MVFHNLFILCSLIITTSTFAKECFTVKEKDILVDWVAYKTPKKLGVGGNLPKVTFTGLKKADSLNKMIKSASLTIDTKTVETKNASRNKKIVKYFFGNMKAGHGIKAKMTKMNKKMITMDLSMNGITKKVPMSYSLKGNTLKATGYIDVIDFSLSRSLKAINKACYALHEGKTWADVKLDLTVKFTKC